MHLSGFRLSALALTCLVSCLPVAAQQLISAKSGLIHYTEGDVRIGDQPAGSNNGVFQSLANGKELTTTEGRAEMLLGPGQFVRLNENSAVRMVSNKLDATRIDLVNGSILVELVEVEKNAPVTIGFGINTVELRKAGLYRVDAAESRLRVMSGEAVVHGESQNLTAHTGKEVSLGAVLAENGFDVAAGGDEFTRWAMRRAGYVATANISGARDAYANGQNLSAGEWAYNPWYDMYTYVPGRRMMLSPFGFNYFTPDMAFNDMFWPYLGGGYGFYGMGFGYGYGFGMPFYGPGYGYGYGPGYGYGYGSGYGYGGGSTGGGAAPGPTHGIGRGLPRGPGGPIASRPFGPSPRPGGGYGSPSPAVRGGGSGYGNSGGGRSYGGGGGYSSSGGGSSHSSGGSSSSSGGGGHMGGGSSSGGFSSSGGGGHMSGGGGGVSSSGGASSSSSARAK